MSRLLSAAIGTCLLCGVGVSQVDTLWMRHHQYSPSYSYQYMYSGRTMAVDGSGNSYACAYGYYDSNSFDCIVLKYGPDGSLMWSRSYDGGSSDYAYALAIDPDGAVYVTGMTYLDGGYSVLTVKWSTNGTFQWVNRIHGTLSSYYHQGYALVVDRGAVYVTGQISNTTSGQDIVLAKIDASSGATLWTRSLSRCSSSGYYERGVDIQVDALGAAYVAGVTHCGSDGYDATVAKYDTSGNQLWVYNYSRAAGSNEYLYRICLSGGLVVATGYLYPNSGTGDALTVACSCSSGAGQWSAQYGGPGGGYDYGRDIAADNSGNIVVCGAGSGSGGYDMMILKYSPAGSLLWSRLRDGGVGSDDAFCVDIDDYGNILVGGRVMRSSPSGYRMAVLQYGTDGCAGWSYFYPTGEAGGVNSAQDIVQRGSVTHVAGTTYWPYPNYSDPMVMKLHEVPDVGVQAILSPPDTVTLGTSVAPRARVVNYSLVPATFPCSFEIADGYGVDTTLTLGAHDTVVVDFPPWTPDDYGNWGCDCQTKLVQDYNWTNDRKSRVAYVPGCAVDAGVRALVEPSRNVRAQAVITPAGRFRNYGTIAADIWAFMKIYRGGTVAYADSHLLSSFQPDGYDTLVEFRSWVTTQVGFFTARCSTWTTGDLAPVNDTAMFDFGVVNQPMGEWEQLADVPILPSGRPPYQGAALALGDAAIYVLKGNKTNDVHAFSLATLSWHDVPPVPEGPSQCAVRKGGKMAADPSGRLYVVKGNRTCEFYRYDPVVGWEALADIPLGERRKGPRGGTGLEYAVVNDSGYIYFLKGTNTNEFYRYHIGRDSWDEMPPAPAGRSGKAKYKYGSALEYDGDHTLYCLKGKYNEIFKFDVRTNSWASQLDQDVPFYGSSGRKKKVKQGGDMCWANGVLAALKGGNTTEFWRLEAADSAWHEYPSVPKGPSNKRVKYGAGVAYLDGSYYLLKASKTQEFWKFTLAEDDGGGVASTRSIPPRKRFRLEVFPNPVDGGGHVRLGGVAPGPFELTVYDNDGRLVLRRLAGHVNDDICLETAGLVPGVYFVKARVASGVAGAKLVVAR